MNYLKMKARRFYCLLDFHFHWVNLIMSKKSQAILTVQYLVCTVLLDAIFAVKGGMGWEITKSFYKSNFCLWSKEDDCVWKWFI